MTVNILGDTEQQMWLNAIDIYRLAVYENVNAVRNHMDDGSDEWLGCEDAEMLDKAMSTVNDFADEMKRFVKAVYEKEEA